MKFEQVRPAGSWKRFDQGGLGFDYPSNWKISNSQGGGILVAPPAAVEPSGAIAYGLSIHAANASGTLAERSRQLVDDIVQGNPGMMVLGGPNRLRVNGVGAIAYELVGNSPVHGSGGPMRERDWLVTLPRPDGSSVALVFTSPDRDYDEMKMTFQTMLRSFRLQ